MASVNFNMNKNSGFGDINNCNSLNSSVVSSPTVNSIRRNSFYKLTNVLLLLFLVFGSCVVNFGMNENEKEENNEIEKHNPINNSIPNNNNDIKYDRFFIFKGTDDEAKKRPYRDLNTANKIVDTILKIFHYCGSIHIYDYHNEYFHDNKIINGVYVGLIDTFYFNFLPIKRFYGYKNFSESLKNILKDHSIYLGFADVGSIGFLFRMVLVWQPSLRLPRILQNRVQIHILEFKPLFYILDYFFIGMRNKDKSWIIHRTIGLDSKGTIEVPVDKAAISCENIPLTFMSLEIRIFKYLHFRVSAQHLICYAINKLWPIIKGSGNKGKKNINNNPPINNNNSSQLINDNQI